MNGMMNDTTGDDAVIARLRSALDEVAAGVDTSAADPDTLGQLAGSSAAPVIALRSGAADRRPGRAWLGVAAATAVLVGAGGWALTQRSTPAATGESTTIAPTPTPSLPGTTNLPWFELRLPDAVAGDEETVTTDPQANGFTQSWVVRGRNGDPSSLGVLSIDVRYDQNDLGVTGDASAFTPIDAPSGTAWLHNDPSGASSGGLALVWQRGDGSVWWVSQAGLLDPAGSDAGSFAEYVFQVQRGTFNDLLNNPDEQAEWMGTAPANGIVTRTQNYAVGDDAAGVVLVVASTMLLPALDGTTGITEVAVAGNRSWKGTRPDGQVTVVWLIGPDAWGLLRISPQLADRVDEIIEAVTPVAANVGEPAPVETTLVPVTVPVTDPVTAPAPPVTADASAQPWFELGLTDAEAGTPQSGELPGVGYSVWQIDDLPTSSGPASGYLLLTTLSPEMSSAELPTDGPGAVDLDGFPEGTATLSGPDADEPNTIVWKRSDGSTWLIGQAGLVAAGGTLDDQQPFIDLARSLTPGSGVPVVLPSPSATLLGATTSARLANQEYSVGAENCPLEVSVANWPPVVDLAPGETNPVVTTILGFPGLMGIAGDGGTVVTWDAGNGWWGELAVASCAADRIDEIIASLVPAVLPASTPAP